jgi:predicted nucleic acid-binding protein
MSPAVLVLDASVGVKWFRAEQGSDAAWDLLASHRSGEVILAVDTLFMYEVLGALSRTLTSTHMDDVWKDLSVWNLAVVPVSQRLVVAATAQREALACSLYDAFSAGLASLLRCQLVSADARAHGGYPNVRIIGD